MKAIYFESNIVNQGKGADAWLKGETVYTIVLLTITWKAAIISDTFVRFTYVAIFGSIAFWFTFFPIYATVAPLIGVSPELFAMIPDLFSSASFWFTILLVPILVNIRDFGWRYYKRNYQPQSYHIIQEIQKFNIPDYRPRMEWFRKAVHKVRQVQRLKRSRGFAFSQNESGQADLIRVYDTTRRKPKG